MNEPAYNQSPRSDDEFKCDEKPQHNVVYS